MLAAVLRTLRMFFGYVLICGCMCLQVIAVINLLERFSASLHYFQKAAASQAALEPQASRTLGGADTVS